MQVARCAVPLALLLTPIVPARPSAAESALRLEVPAEYGRIPASTYDEDGRRVGGAELSIEDGPDGQVTLAVASGIEGGERTVASADLVRVDAGESLQILRQRSRSMGADGKPLGVLSIDHVEGIGSCSPPPGNGGSTKTLRLPADDRIANVPLNLVFLPLARGEMDEMSFQIFLCRFGPRVLNARAKVSRREPARDGKPQPVEVAYELQMPLYLSKLARPFLPRIAMWFDAGSEGHWLGHRMPLFAKGPTVMVVRSGTSPSALSAF
jgi:hypothetical protein